MNASSLIHDLQLLPHPEGGYYKETYRSKETLINTKGKARNLCTAIYFLLQDKEKSHFHRIQSDELWFFHEGQPLEICYIQDNEILSVILGKSIEKGEAPFHRIPANTWFASRVKGEQGFALVSCTVSPGFDFEDFELAERNKLNMEFPHLKSVIETFTPI